MGATYLKIPAQFQEYFLRNVFTNYCKISLKIVQDDYDVICLLQIVEILLDKSSLYNVYESLLLAISFDHDDIAEMIIKHDVYVKIKGFRASGFHAKSRG